MPVQPVVQRSTQKAVLALGNGAFNGNIKAVLLPVDVLALSFYANVTVNFGTPNATTYTPADDNGKIRKFGDADDLVKWLKAAYFDIVSVELSIADFDLISRVFVPASDPIADATKKKAAFMKLNTGLDDNLMAINAQIAAAVASGWNDPQSPNYHPALQANYNAYVAQKDVIVASKAYYAGRVTFYNAIINPQ